MANVGQPASQLSGWPEKKVKRETWNNKWFAINSYYKPKQQQSASLDLSFSDGVVGRARSLSRRISSRLPLKLTERTDAHVYVCTCMHACMRECVPERALTFCMPCIHYVKYFILLLSKKKHTNNDSTRSSNSSSSENIRWKKNGGVWTTLSVW